MRIKWVIGAAGLLVAVASAWAQAVGTPELNGIFYWKNEAQALLELPSGKRGVMRPILRTGESFEGFKVKSVDEKMGRVELLSHGENMPITLDLGLPLREQLPQRTFHFRSADLGQVFEVYQEVSARTIIRSGNLAISKIDLKSTSNLTPEEAVGALEKKIAETGIKMKPVGTKFVFALGKGDEQRIESLRQPPIINPADEKFAPGLMKFTSADAAQVLDIYWELTRQPRIERNLPRGSKITLRSQTGLTRREAAWVLEAALLLNGVPLPSQATNLN
jgi:hypothetical protein